MNPFKQRSVESVDPPRPPVMRRPNPPQSSEQIKAKVTAMREATDKEIDRLRTELVRLESLVREGEMLAAAVVDRYEDVTNRVRNAMSDLFSTGIGELADVMQSANEQALRHLEERVSPDTEAPRFGDYVAEMRQKYPDFGQMAVPSGFGPPEVKS